MPKPFEILAWNDTPNGAISLRRRTEHQLGIDVYEVKLGDEWLMSSLFTVAEIELAKLGLAALPKDASDLDVIVGGLGLGYTALAALEDSRVGSMSVVEALPDVIDWHERELVPAAPSVMADARTRLILGDFFALSATTEGWDPDVPGRQFDAVLLDIDHTPRHFLAPSHETFYSPDGLASLAAHIKPGGVFALWSDDPEDADFMRLLQDQFVNVSNELVVFANPLTGGESSNSVYLAHVQS